MDTKKLDFEISGFLMNEKEFQRKVDFEKSWVVQIRLLFGEKK